MNAPTETDVLTACGFRLLARAETAHPTYRPGLIAAALVVFTDAEHVANAVGAWDSTAAGQLRHLAGAADTQKTWESRDHDTPPHVHRHQWQVEDYVCECGDVLARGLWR